MNIESFTRLLQLSISPIAVISGAGLLLLSITNRMSRTIDRARQLAYEAETNHDRDKIDAGGQLQILIKRSEILRNSGFFTGLSVFFSTLMILGLCMRLFMEWPVESYVLLLLFSSVGSLCVSMVFFLLDVSLSLKAMKIELRKYL